MFGQLVVHLGKRMRVAVLCPRLPSEHPADKRVLEHVEILEEVPRPEITAFQARALRGARSRPALLAGRPLLVSDLQSRHYRKSLETLIRRFRPEIVQMETVAMAQYISSFAGCGAPRVLVDHDPMVKPFAGTAHTLLDRLNLLAWRRFERRVLREVDTAVVFTEQDRATISPFAGDTPVVRIPFGTDLVERSPATTESDGSILFIGNFLHAPNVDAARRLVTSIFPRVHKRHPECVLYMVGHRPPLELIDDSATGVVFAGRVPDITPYLERAAVVVAPLHQGGGMRVKVLEALAAGKALVVSPLAAQGLDVADGEQLLVAETDADFAVCIDRLLDEPAARTALAERARSWAEDNLSWTATVQAYEQLYEQLLARRHPDQASH